jgi:hypothetical protein
MGSADQGRRSRHVDDGLPHMVNGHGIAHGGFISCWRIRPSPLPATPNQRAVARSFYHLHPAGQARRPAGGDGAGDLANRLFGSTTCASPSTKQRLPSCAAIPHHRRRRVPTAEWTPRRDRRRFQKLPEMVMASTNTQSNSSGYSAEPTRRAGIARRDDGAADQAHGASWRSLRQCPHYKGFTRPG